MKKNIQENKLTLTIIISALVITGALIFLGLRIGGNTSNTSTKSFAEQLEQYQKEQEQKQINVQKERKRLAEEKAEKVDKISDSDHVYGDRNAKITLYEYSDFECPFCKKFYKTPKQLVKDNKGLLNTVWRHFPLNFHDPLATKEALASECVAELGGNDKFWQYHDKIFETTNSNGRGMEASQLTTLATDLGISKSSFQKCLDDEKYLEKVKANINSGISAGVTGTPGIIIKNNTTGKVKFVPGALPIEAVQAFINELK